MRLVTLFASAGLLFCGQANSAPWSPDGSMIAYSFIGGPENLYMVDADGTNQRDLVIKPERNFRPEWAPDGSHILYTSVIDNAHVMMRVDPDGSNIEQLTQPDQAAGGADYSPDGKSIVFFTDEPVERDLYLRDTVSGEVKSLTQTNDFDEMSPRYSPDGKSVVFVGKAKADGAESDIWSMNIKTGEQKNLTNSADAGEFHPDWSQDGTHIVYIRVKDGAFDVAIRNVETLEEKIIAPGNGYAVLSPHFSPNDEAVSFTRTDFSEEAEGMPAIVKVNMTDLSEETIVVGKYLSQMAE